MNILHCYSDGNPRFSALNARFRSGASIEEVYQFSKRDGNKRPLGTTVRSCKGKPPVFLSIGSSLLPASPIIHDWYRLLWDVYFRQGHLDLLAEAMHYDGFVDKYDGRRGHVFMPLPGYLHGERCAQSAAIASIVYEVVSRTPYPYPPELLSSLENTQYFT